MIGIQVLKIERYREANQQIKSVLRMYSFVNAITSLVTILSRLIQTYLVNFLLRSQPYTPPPSAYRVPVIISTFVSSMSLTICGINFG